MTWLRGLRQASLEQLKMPKRLLVAIVDDEADCAGTTALLVRQFGHEARTYLSAEDALRRCQESVPDVMLADIGMPRMNGYELASQIRGSELLQKLILVAVTGHADEEHRIKAINAGFDYRFVKPLEPDELRAFLQLIATK